MQQWKIRILSGVHIGVEVTLPNDSLVLGSDDFTADLVLTDPDIKASHLVLVCDGETVQLQDCEDVFINRESVIVDTDGIELSRNVLVSVGRLTFAVGHLEDDLVIDIAKEAADRQAAPVSYRALSGRKRTVLLCLLCSLLSSMIFTSLWYRDIQASDNDSTVIAEPIALVRSILSELHLNDVRVEWNTTLRQALLEGYVESRTEKLQLLAKIEALGINYKIDVRTMEDIRRGVRFILRNFGYHQVKVENGKDAGTLLLKGNIEDTSCWSQVEHILERDVPGLVAWKVEMSRTDAYMDTLKTLLDKAKLLKKVQLMTSGDRIEVCGELDDIETTRFHDVTRDFRKLYGEKPYLVLKSIPKVSKGTNIDFPFRSVNFGPVPYVILTDNVRYIVGARTPQGYRISSVTPAGIELVKDRRLITIDIGDDGGNTYDKS